MRKMLLFSLFALVIPLKAASPPIGAVVESWSIDTQNHTVTLHIFNSSAKEITAYNIKIRETYGSRVNEHEFSTDTVALMFNIDENAGTPRGEELQRRYGKNGTFAPSSNHDEVIVVQPGLTDFSAVMDTVIYADKTAESTNPDGLKRLLDARARFATTIQAGNDIIQKALANPDDPNPDQTALAQIEAFQNKGNHQAEAGAFYQIKADLKGAAIAAPLHGQSIRDYLNNYVAKRNERATKLLEHSKAGGAQ